MNQLSNDEYFLLLRSLKQTEVWRIHSQMLRLSASYYMFQANYFELAKGIALNPAQHLILFDVRNHQQMESMLIEIVRRLHNFVASAKTLVDHTRRVVKKLYRERNPSFFAIYQNEINLRFLNNGEVQFVEDLRNYTLHCELPLTSAALNAKHEITIRLDVEALRKWKSWTPLARQHLNQLSDDHDIDEIATSYFRLVSDFHVWLRQAQYQQDKDAFEQAETLRQKLIHSDFHRIWGGFLAPLFDPD